MSSSNYNFEGEIPRKLHFVWLGRKDIPPINDTFKDGDGKFRSKTVAENANNNPSCESTMWLDAFTMVTSNDIRQAVLSDGQQHGDLLLKYTRWAKIAQGGIVREAVDGPSGPDRVPTDMSKEELRNPANFDMIVDMVWQVRELFNTWLIKNRPVFHRGSPIGDITALCESNARPIKVEFLDTTQYVKWMSDKSRKEYKLLRWILFELYMRGSNFGAASDMLRTQLLIDHGGMYVDHDDELPEMHDPKNLDLNPQPQVEDKPLYRGFKHMVAVTKDQQPYNPVKRDSEGNKILGQTEEKMWEYYMNQATTGFLAASKEHPFLIVFRDRMLDDYARLLANNYYWRSPSGKPRCNLQDVFTKDPQTLKDVKETKRVQWFDYERGKGTRGAGWLNFAAFGIEVTGPGQLDQCLNYAGEPDFQFLLGGPHGIIHSIEQRAKNNYSNSWIPAGFGGP